MRPQGGIKGLHRGDVTRTRCWDSRCLRPGDTGLRGTGAQRHEETRQYDGDRKSWLSAKRQKGRKTLNEAEESKERETAETAKTAEAARTADDEDGNPCRSNRPAGRQERALASAPASKGGEGGACSITERERKRFSTQAEYGRKWPMGAHEKVSQVQTGRASAIEKLPRRKRVTAQSCSLPRSWWDWEWKSEAAWACPCRSSCSSGHATSAMTASRCASKTATIKRRSHEVSGDAEAADIDARCRGMVRDTGFEPVTPTVSR